MTNNGGVEHWKTYIANVIKDFRKDLSQFNYGSYGIITAKSLALAKENMSESLFIGLSKYLERENKILKRLDGYLFDQDPDAHAWCKINILEPLAKLRQQGFPGHPHADRALPQDSPEVETRQKEMEEIEKKCREKINPILEQLQEMEENRLRKKGAKFTASVDEKRDPPTIKPFPKKPKPGTITAIILSHTKSGGKTMRPQKDKNDEITISSIAHCLAVASQNKFPVASFSRNLRRYGISWQLTDPKRPQEGFILVIPPGQCPDSIRTKTPT